MEEGTIEDGPYEVEDWTCPVYVVWFLHTARLIGDEGLRLKDEERWVACPGTHRVKQAGVPHEWEKKVTA